MCSPVVSKGYTLYLFGYLSNNKPTIGSFLNSFRYSYFSQRNSMSTKNLPLYCSGIIPLACSLLSLRLRKIWSKRRNSACSLRIIGHFSQHHTMAKILVKAGCVESSIIQKMGGVRINRELRPTGLTICNK